MSRKEVVFKIGDLIESNCHGCKKNPFSQDGRLMAKRTQWCRDNCSVSEQLKELGKQL